MLKLLKHPNIVELKEAFKRYFFLITTLCDKINKVGVWHSLKDYDRRLTWLENIRRGNKLPLKNLGKEGGKIILKNKEIFNEKKIFPFRFLFEIERKDFYFQKIL